MAVCKTSKELISQYGEDFENIPGLVISGPFYQNTASSGCCQCSCSCVKQAYLYFPYVFVYSEVFTGIENNQLLINADYNLLNPNGFPPGIFLFSEGSTSLYGIIGPPGPPLNDGTSNPCPIQSTSK